MHSARTSNRKGVKAPALPVSRAGTRGRPGVITREGHRMAKYTRADVTRHANRAQLQGLKVLGTEGDFVFTVPGSQGDALYTVIVGNVPALPAEAVCNCPAGEHGIQCKHAAAALSLVRKARLSLAGHDLRVNRSSDAARTLRQSQA